MLALLASLKLALQMLPALVTGTAETGARFDSVALFLHYDIVASVCRV